MTVSFDVTLVGPADLAEAWTAAFRGTPVSVQAGDILARARGQALVSPANSFGWMSGGLDLAIAGAYGPAVDIGRRVQAAIQQDAGGELPVGQALVVPTPEGRFSHLVCAPTMRTPKPVETSLNAYLAFRALLRAVTAWNAQRPSDPIRHVYCPGLGTGVGGIPPGRAARQMRGAWDQVAEPGLLPSLERAASDEARWRG